MVLAGDTVRRQHQHHRPNTHAKGELQAQHAPLDGAMEGAGGGHVCSQDSCHTTVGVGPLRLSCNWVLRDQVVGWLRWLLLHLALTLLLPLVLLLLAVPGTTAPLLVGLLLVLTTLVLILCSAPSLATS
jgi:hypothetical protein